MGIILLGFSPFVPLPISSQSIWLLLCHLQILGFFAMAFNLFISPLQCVPLFFVIAKFNFLS